MTRTTSVIAVLAVVLGAGVLWLLRAGADEVARPDRDGVVSIAIEGTEFSPSRIVLPVGEPITLVVDNRNDFIHHLAVGRTLQEDESGAAFAEDLFAGIDAHAEPSQAWLAPTEGFGNVTLVLHERATASFELTLPDDRVGTWQVGCFIGRGCEARILEATEVVVE